MTDCQCEIVVCGDICPTPDTVAKFAAGDVAGLFGGANQVLQSADLIIGNLECPLMDGGKGIEKCGPVLGSSRKSIRVLKDAGFGILSLANNHIRDYGDAGVISTMGCCEENKIKTVGAGPDRERARVPVVATRNGISIAVLAYAEQEFNAANESSAGANVFDPYVSLQEISDQARNADYVIVLYHGGIERYQYPSPWLQEKSRAMIRAGADIVLCQHSHCVGTVERFMGGTILYGQGNSVYGYRSYEPPWNEGLIVRILLRKQDGINHEIEFIPIKSHPGGIDRMGPAEAHTFSKQFTERSRFLEDAEFIRRSWKEYCRFQRAHYFPLLLGLGRVLNYINRQLCNRLVDLLYSRKRMRVTLNLVRCEAHREVVQTILEDAVGQDECVSPARMKK